jgi:AraC family ethanolamine operon transcriptional activator
MHPACQSVSRRTASREAVVERAESYLRANAGLPIPVSQLCRVVGLSERGLRNAFYRVRGMSPTQSMLHARLIGVRRALIERDGPVTVTDVAVRFGFFELGRFAATYRRAFGESPSDTLRASERRVATGTGSPLPRE